MTDIDHRIGVYDVIEGLNQCTNKIIAYMPQGVERDEILDELKNTKRLVNRL